MNIVTAHSSPNFTDLEIPVEFVVLHFTATTLERTLQIFKDTTSEVSSHLVIDRDGTVYELVACLHGSALRAWHAGKSRLEVVTHGDARLVESFNDRSIGIELVNLNGNLFPYSEAQYASLFGVFERLKALYPALEKPESVVGHEQIAGFRGKCDPGIRFEWDRLFSVCYAGQGAPRRSPVCRQGLVDKMSALVRGMGVKMDPGSGEVATLPSGLNPSFFEHLSALAESALSKEDQG
jgi:N-acetylmuramoyl-L-alanine amidase